MFSGCLYTGRKDHKKIVCADSGRYYNFDKKSDLSDSLLLIRDPAGERILEGVRFKHSGKFRDNSIVSKALNGKKQ